MRHLRRLRFAVAALASALLLYAGLRLVDWPQVGRTLLVARPVPAIAGIAMVISTLLVVTIRWSVLLETPGNGPTITRLWNAIVAGQAINIIAPFRFGDGARLALTCRWLDLAAGRVTMALLVERVADVAAFAATVMALVGIGAMPERFRGAAQIALVLVAGAITVFAGVAYGLPLLVARIKRDALSTFTGAPAARELDAAPGGTTAGEPDPRRAPRLFEWFARQVGEVQVGWQAMSGARLAGIALLTVLILVASATTNLLVFRAFALDVPWFAALVLLVVLQIGTAVVSVPGNVGVFHYLTVLTLGAWSVPADQALAAAVVLHVVSLGPKVVLGGLVLAWSGGAAAWRPVTNPGGQA